MAAFVVKLALYASALGAAGLTFAAATLYPSPKDARDVLRAAARLAVAAAGVAGLRFALDAATLAGGWGHIGEPPYLSWTLEAQAGFLTLLGVGAVVAAGAGWLGRRWPAALGGLLMAIAFAATGHVAASPHAGWLRVALGAHLAGVAFWLTAPVLLWPALSRGDAETLARVGAFSRVAVGVVPIALGSGLVLAVGLVEAPTDLVATAYGRLILVKVFAASAAFGLGALNKVWVTRRLAEDLAKGRAALRATLSADALLFAAALAAVAAATTLVGRPG